MFYVGRSFKKRDKKDEFTGLASQTMVPAEDEVVRCLIHTAPTERILTMVIDVACEGKASQFSKIQADSSRI